MTDPDDYPVMVAYLFDLNVKPHKELGELLCLTQRDVDALKYALKHVENIGIEIMPAKDFRQ